MAELPRRQRARRGRALEFTRPAGNAEPEPCAPANIIKGWPAARRCCLGQPVRAQLYRAQAAGPAPGRSRGSLFASGTGLLRRGYFGTRGRANRRCRAASLPMGFEGSRYLRARALGFYSDRYCCFLGGRVRATGDLVTQAFTLGVQFSKVKWKFTQILRGVAWSREF